MPPNRPHKLHKALSLCLATSLAASTSFAQSSDATRVRQLEDEVATLRRQLAEAQGRPAPAPLTQPSAPTTSTSPTSTGLPTTPLAMETGVETLSPFQVSTEKDYGYLRTNSSTATRIGTEIQKVPLSISVISEDFIKDLNFVDIQDVLRYQSSSSGDTKMGILQPATGFTPSGNMSLRGFPINSRLRNGLIRYNAYTLDNIDRVEVIKGPASVFFGNAFPGGVINYVTKLPTFNKIPTGITYGYTSYDNRMGGQRVTLDHNAVLSDKAALRIVGAWDNAKGDRRFEFQKGFSVNASSTIVPLKSGILRVTVEGEFLKRDRNQDDNSWFYPQKWFDDYRTPPANLIAIAGLSANADPAGAYRTRILGNIGQWIADVRNAAGDQYIPLWTAPLEHGAYITDRSGRRYKDEKFNYYGAGSMSNEENTTFSVTTEFSPLSWLDIRHSYTGVQSTFDRLISTASPLADGVRFNALNSITKQGYDIDAYYHQLDLVFKTKVAGIDNKFLVGGFLGETYNSFTGSVGANLAGTGQYPFFGNLPGAFDKLDEGYVSPIPANLRSTSFAANVAAEFVRDRNGKILTPMEIFSLYDPGVHTSPDVRRIGEVSRGLVDHSRPTRTEWYANYQATAFQDRLTAFVGYRKERTSTVGQLVSANPPWFTVGDYALQNIPQSQWVTYGLSEVFSRSRVIKGTSKMAGLSFEVVKDVNVYASFSQTFLPPGVQYLGGDTDPQQIRNRAVEQGKDPTAEFNRVVAGGFFTEIQNEKGKNMELGVKVSLNDSKLVGTASVYRVTRQNRTLDDFQRQFDEPLNTIPGGTQGGSRVLRWYTASAEQETEGFEFESIWSPVRNYQAVLSGGWMWSAETVADPTLTVTPTNPALARPIVFGNRLPYAPKYRFNFFNKYTFTQNLFGEYGQGLSVGGGFRYSSKINIGLDQNFNPSRGGLTAGDYVVYDAVLSYPFEVYGYAMSTTLNVNNVTDKVYSEGNFSLSPPRSFILTLGMKF